MLWACVTLYAVLGGADFGGGFWDLFAGGARRGRPARRLIARVMGPVWEANHVWLIFALVILWTAFPGAFGSAMSALTVPLMLVALGVILRGSAFAFRHVFDDIPTMRAFGAVFALSSVVTPFFLGVSAGAVASGVVGAGNALAERPWLNPTSWFAGTLAVSACAWLAAVYLCNDARRSGDERLEAGFRHRALVSGLVTGALTLAGIVVIRADAPGLYLGLTGPALPLALLSVVAGLGTIVLVLRRRYVLARIGSALAVATVIWGWGLAQYPDLLPGRLDLHAAAAGPAVLEALLWVVLAGAVILLPALWFLFRMFQVERDAGR